MKKLLIVVLLALCASLSFAQTTEPVKVEVSTEKANINGVPYYVHKVQPRQTVYSICKAYGVTTEQLLEVNSSLKNGLKAGSILFVPIAAPQEQTQQVHPTELEEEIARQEEAPQYKTHRVKWYENLRSIARKYKVSPEAIAALNGLEGDVKTRQILRIPDEEPIEEPTENTPTVEEQKSEEEISEMIVNEYEHKRMSKSEATAKMRHLMKMEHFSQEHPVNVSLVLPFNSQTKSPSSNYMDFYSGALLALYEMKAAGLSVNLNTIDLSAYSWKGEILESDNFKKSHIVIGPVESEDIPPFADYCKEHRIPFVSPMDHEADSLALNNPYFFDVPTSPLVQMNNLINTLDLGRNDNVIVFYNHNTSEGKYNSAMVKSLLEAYNIPYNAISYKISRGRVITDSLKRVINRRYTHKVIVASEDKAFASDVIRNMQLLKLSNIPVVLYISNRVRNFETVDSKVLYELNTHVCAPYYVDYNSEEAKQFVLKYRALFHTEPTPFAFQGHDVFKYFLSALKDFGEDFTEYVAYYPMNMIQCNFKFEKVSEEGGYANRGTKLIEYLPNYFIFAK